MKHAALKAPTDLTELCSFLGFCNFFRRFVSSFARLAAPLKKKLRKNQPRTFRTLNEEELQSMQSLWSVLMSPPVFALRHSTGHLTLLTDECYVQVGYVLAQEQSDRTVESVGYWSGPLTDTDRRYGTT